MKRGLAPLVFLAVALSAVPRTLAAGEAAPAFLRADTPRTWSFPRDHGSHPGFGTEWWYFTGIVEDERGRVLGYELTFFRVALRPDAVESVSPWRARDLMLAHFAITDVDGQRFLLAERVQRAAADMAGATEDDLHVWIGDWSVRRTDDGLFRLHAREISDEKGERGLEHPAMAIDLELRIARGPILHGEDGLSIKDSTGREASYYYSIPRLLTSGTMKIANETRVVSGTTWMDQEFFTGDTPREGLGWDWFSARLSDGRDLMLYRVRRPTEPDACFGTLVAADGSSRPIDAEGAVFTPLDHWTSPRSGNRYPIAWRVELPAERAEFAVRGRLAAQEVVAEETVGFAYWEGLSQYEGRWDGMGFTGEGYVELTGYARTPATGRSPDAR
jgi:predicted secreted hydrolase